MVKIGLVGKPNVGKSTLFYALTLKPVEISMRPFTTINPNIAYGFVRKECVHKLLGLDRCNPMDGGFCEGGFRFIPVEICDIAGLVPDAHKGRGLGNKFLDDIRQVDGFIIILDGSNSLDSDGNFVGVGKGSTLEDLDFLLKELEEWFSSIFLRNFEKLKKKVVVESKDIIEEMASYLSGVGINKADIEYCLKELNLEEDISKWKKEEALDFSKNLLWRSKPFVVVVNKIDIEESKDTIKTLKEKYKNIDIFPVSAKAELILRKLSKESLVKYIPGDSDFKVLKENLDGEIKKAIDLIREKIFEDFGGTGVINALNHLVFKKLNYICVYPVATEKFTDNDGNILPNAILIKRGATVEELMDKIHSDFKKLFKKAVNLTTRKLVGRDYILNDNDVIRIII